MKGFCRKKGGARELLAKENKELFLEQDTFLGGEMGRNHQHFWRLPLLPGRRSRGSHWQITSLVPIRKFQAG